MNCDQAADLLELYALGVLDAGESTQLRAHLAEGCATCARNLRRALDLNSAVLSTAPDAVPPASLRRRVLDAARRRRAAGWQWAAAALAAGLALAVAWTGRGWNEARRELAEVRLQRDAAEADAQRSNAALSFLRAPETRPAAATGTGTQPGGSWYINPRAGVLLIASNLPALPAGKTYQMWVISKGQAPRPAGLFRPDDSGGAVHLDTNPVDPGAIQALAVSVEPAQGSAAPSTTPLLVQPVGE